MKKLIGLLLLINIIISCNNDGIKEIVAERWGHTMWGDSIPKTVYYFNKDSTLNKVVQYYESGNVWKEEVYDGMDVIEYRVYGDKDDLIEENLYKIVGDKECTKCKGNGDYWTGFKRSYNDIVLNRPIKEAHYRLCPDCRGRGIVTGRVLQSHYNKYDKKDN